MCKRLQQLLAGFPASTPGIVMVQHMPADFTSAFASRLHNDPRIEMEVVEAQQHEPVRPGRAILIPGDLHGVIRRSGTGYRVELVEGPPVCRHRPSVDVLFRSAAQAAGPFGAGVIMTGMGDDGAGGLLEMRESGSFTMAQNEATCIVFGMPREAIRRGAAKLITPLDSIAPTVLAWAASCGIELVALNELPTPAKKTAAGTIRVPAAMSPARQLRVARPINTDRR